LYIVVYRAIPCLTDDQHEATTGLLRHEGIEHGASQSSLVTASERTIVPNAIVLQCGGPTATVNASLWGIISAWHHAASDGALWGGRHGLRALTTDDRVDLTRYEDVPGRGLEHQPGAALGGGRDPLPEQAIDDAIDRLLRTEIGIVFVIGGNGSMGAADAIERRAGGSLRVIGIPKTIDNDLHGTYVSPGYGSAARFVAESVRDIALDLRSMTGFEDVALVETMGRHTGWLAAASALARARATDPPHLILTPEAPVPEREFLEAVRARHAAHGTCLAVVAEGVRDAHGEFYAEKDGPQVERDASGQKLFTRAGGPLPYFARLVREQLRLRCRQVRPDTLQRASSASASAVDRKLAVLVGAEAVTCALDGESGVMIGVERVDDDWTAASVPLKDVAGRERTLPTEFVDTARFDVTRAFRDYARPLIGAWRPEIIEL